MRPAFLFIVCHFLFVGVGDEGEGAVADDVAGGAEAILKGKNR